MYGKRDMRPQTALLRVPVWYRCIVHTSVSHTVVQYLYIVLHCEEHTRTPYSYPVPVPVPVQTAVLSTVLSTGTCSDEKD